MNNKSISLAVRFERTSTNLFIFLLRRRFDLQSISFLFTSSFSRFSFSFSFPLFFFFSYKILTHIVVQTIFFERGFIKKFFFIIMKIMFDIIDNCATTIFLDKIDNKYYCSIIKRKKRKKRQNHISQITF